MVGLGIGAEHVHHDLLTHARSLPCCEAEGGSAGDHHGRIRIRVHLVGAHQATGPEAQTLHVLQLFRNPFAHLVQHAAHGGARDRVCARPQGARSVRTIAVALQVDDVRIDVDYLLVLDAQPFRNAGTEVVNEHIRRRDQLQHRRAASIALQVDGQALVYPHLPWPSRCRHRGLGRDRRSAVPPW